MTQLVAGVSIGTIVLVVFGLILLLLALFTVKQKTVAIIERFGKFARISRPGLQLRIPIFDEIAGRPSLRTIPLVEPVTSISKDKTGVRLDLAIQYRRIDSKEDLFNSFYQLTNVDMQLKQALYDAVRSVVPEHDLDDLFLKKDDIARAVSDRLGPKFKQYGFEIEGTNITGIDPLDDRILKSMADINIANRQNAIAEANGLALFTEKEWEGKAFGAMRTQMAKSFDAAITEIGGEDMSDERKDAIMASVLVLQWIAMAEAIGNGPNGKAIFLSSDPSAAGDMTAAFRKALLEAEVATPTS
ncbi:MAG: SPFH domain-containing protein [Minisyncoccia bacterium]